MPVSPFFVAGGLSVKHMPVWSSDFSHFTAEAVTPNQIIRRNIVNEISCMECGAMVLAGGDLIMGEILECPECGVELEVVQLSPLAVELAPEIEEDWGE